MVIFYLSGVYGGGSICMVVSLVANNPHKYLFIY